MAYMNDEIDALLERISSPCTRRAGDAFFSVNPPDLSATYSPDDFSERLSRLFSSRSESTVRNDDP